MVNNFSKIVLVMYLATLLLSWSFLSIKNSLAELRFKLIETKLSLLEKEDRFGSLAPLPGPTAEGTTTAGWTDDGSIVRLNTASDNVGIGTVNPSVKLQVQGAAYVTGNLDVAGGSLNLSQGTATSTLTASSAGRIGLGTTTPGATFSVQGNGLFSGTLSTGNFAATGTTRLNGVTYTWPSADGSSGQVLSTNGAGTFSYVATNNDWTQLAQRISTSSVATTSVVDIPIRKFLTVDIFIASTTGPTSATKQLTFNNDSSVSYSWQRLTGGVLATGANDTKINIDGQNTSTTAMWLLRINNDQKTTRKLFSWDAVTTGAGPTAAPELITGQGLWNGRGSDITSIAIGTGNADTFSTGTRITVYGSND